MYKKGTPQTAQIAQWQQLNGKSKMSEFLKQLLTFIVPIHNGEKWLNVCFDSLISQTNKNFAVIAVLDSSTDESEAIVNQYRDRLNLQVYAVSYKSAAASRNYGIEQTRTPYLSFIDCDDYIRSEFVADSQYLVEESPTNWRNIYTFGIKGRECLNVSDLTQNTCVARIYNTAFLNRNGIRFCDVPKTEDSMFVAKCFTANLSETNNVESHIQCDKVNYYVARNERYKYRDMNAEQKQRAIDYMATYLPKALQMNQKSGVAYICGQLLVEYGTESARQLYSTLSKVIKHRLQQNSILREKEYRARVKKWNKSNADNMFKRLTARM